MTLRSLLGIFASAVFVVGCAQSDAGITTNVKSKLIADDLVKARKIDVDTQDHVVTLTGTVQSAEEESQALQIARNTKGVTNVVDNIDVAAPESNAAPTSGTEPSTMASDSTGAMSSTGKDAELTAQVKAALIGERSIKGQQIEVEAHEGVVTLRGVMGSKAEKDKAVEVAGKVTSVARVDDQLTVK